MMNKWIRACIMTSCLAGSVTIAYFATRVEDVLTPSDVQAWRVTDTLHATSKPPVWKNFGLAVAVAGVMAGCWNLWKLLEAEEEGNSPEMLEGTLETLNAIGDRSSQFPPSPELIFNPLEESDASLSAFPARESPYPSPIGDGDGPPGRAEHDRRLEELWKLLNQPENRCLLQLLKARPLLIWGGQNSGKTAFASFLALLRYLFLGLPIEINDPHAHLNTKKWPVFFPIYGWESNYSAIEERVKDYYTRIKKPSIGYVSIWDEFSQYQDNCSEELVCRFMKSILSDSYKANEYPIVISHHHPLSNFGGGEAELKRMYVEGMVEVNLLSERDILGEFTFTGTGAIRGLAIDRDGNAIEQFIQLQEWMQPEYILEKFPELREVHLNNQSQLESSDPASESSLPLYQEINQLTVADFPKVSWEYWVSESTEEEINQLIENRRKKTEVEPEEQPEKKAQPETNLQKEREQEPEIKKESKQEWNAEIFDSYFPETTESAFFEEILHAIDKGMNAREIIRSVLKCSRSKAGSNRSYSEVGKPAFNYLVYKYGSKSLIDHFANFLDK